MNIFGEALKKYVSVKNWDDADGLSTYKALIASYESGTLTGRAQRLALEAKRDGVPTPGRSRRIRSPRNTRRRCVRCKKH